MKHLPIEKLKTLWIGGTSSLARTFFVNYDHVVTSDGKRQQWVLTGSEPEPPQWISSVTSKRNLNIDYISLDLTTVTIQSIDNILTQHNNITSMVVAIRPLLFDRYIYTDTADNMAAGLQLFLERATQELPSLQFVLHISSVAAADHLRAQSFGKENDLLPPLSEYRAPYDRFKRCSEDVVTNICQNANIVRCHLRLSAIFSDDRSCIQCSALELQARVGCYLPLAIDCNSSLNVSRAIELCLNQTSLEKLQPSQTFYYTRPLPLRQPVPYGYYLNEYRTAYGIHKTSIWIPVWMVTWFVAFVHVLAMWNQTYLNSIIPYLDAAEYLLQVAAREHSFDNSAFQHFAEANGNFREETILECFVRRKFYLQSINE
jgi:hypothetical protein